MIDGAPDRNAHDRTFGQGSEAPRPVLVVEDSADDFEALRRAFEREGVACRLTHVEDGEAALALLTSGAEEHPPRLPDLVLLDLNLPGTDGRQVLERIRAHPRLRLIPVIVLSTSTDDRDIDICYSLGANAYVAKPVDFRGFREAARRLQSFWLDLAILPGKEPHR